MDLYKQGKESCSYAVINSFIWRDNVESSGTKMQLNSTAENKEPRIFASRIYFFTSCRKKNEHQAAQVSMLVCIRKSSSPTGYFHGELSLFSLVFSGKCSWVKINHHSFLSCFFKLTILNNRAVYANSIYVLATKKWESEIALFFVLFSY